MSLVNRDDHEVWIHLLLKGEQSDHNTDEDEYESEFKRCSLISKRVPVLSFEFKSIDKLTELLKSSVRSLENDRLKNGLIITSPRVVESLEMAFHSIDCDELSRILQSYRESGLVFVVGEKSGRNCEKKLNLTYDKDSAKSGSAKQLTKYIERVIKNTDSINFIYPKGSLSDNFIEDFLGKYSKVSVHSICTYETVPSKDIGARLLSALRNIDLPCGNIPKLAINLIFFSPSGVNAFVDYIDQKAFMEDLKIMINQTSRIELYFSCLGETTKMALLQNNLQVFCVSREPNARSLVESVQKRLESG